MRNVAGYPGEILVAAEGMRDLRGRWQTLFPAADRLWLEVGCGRGAFLAGLLDKDPRAALLGLEIRPDRCVTARNKLLQANGAGRFRVLHTFAELLPLIFGCGELERIHLNFPDPWPCSPDRSKRLFGPRFLPIYQHLLAPGGELWFKTDDPGAWREFMARRPQALVLLDSGEDLSRSPLFHDNVETEFERLFLSKGQRIHFARVRREIHLPHDTRWP